MTAPRGATPADWRGLTDTLGLTADLLPVVSDTRLPVSPHSQLSTNPDQLGKVPSIVNGTGHITGILKWAQHTATRAQCVAWAKDSRLGVCVIGRQVKAIDIDVADPVLAQRVQDMFTLLLGDLPERFRANSGKRLLPVRLPVYMPKWRFEVAGAEGAVVEILGDSQQFIAAGTHPSGARYEWRGGLPTAIPEVTLSELQDAVRAVYAALGVPGTLRTGRSVLEGAGVRRSTDSTDRAFVDWLWDRGQVVDEAADGALYVVCPWQHEHTDGAAGAPSATVVYPAGVGAEKRGFKCMHAHCEGRDIHAYEAATGWLAHEIETLDGFADEQPAARVAPLEPGAVISQPFETDADWPAFVRDKKGILNTAGNAELALSRPDICGARIGYDDFKAVIMIEWGAERGAWRPLRDTDYFRLRVELEKRGFQKPGTDLMREAVGRVAEIHQFDSAMVWVKGLQWDGQPRVERFWIDCFGVEDTPYARACGRYAWTALAGRALVPGCKVDMTPVLIGEQGLRKTSGVEAMCPTPDAFVEIALDIHDDNLARKMRGKLVGELGELRGMSGKDAEAIRGWFTRREEEWTPKYKEFTVRFPRRLLLIGTGNIPEFLEDETGARRFLPMTVVRQVDTDRIRAERDQLWAEGRALFCAAGHEVEWQEAQTLAKAEHKHFTVTDTWDEAVVAWLDADSMDGSDGPRRGDGLVKVVDILASALGVQIGRTSKRDEMRVAKILSRLGYVRQKRRIGGIQTKVWEKLASDVFC